MLDAVSPRARGAFAAAACGMVAMLAATPPALADPVACGDTITASVTLEADVTGCLGAGLVVGAGDLTIDLNGHRLESGVFNVAPGIDNSGGHDGVKIKDGYITGFSTGVLLVGADDNVLRDIEAVDNGRGVVLTGSDRNRIVGGELLSNDSGLRVGVGILVEAGSDDNRVRGVEVVGTQGAAVAIATSAGNRIVDSTIAGNVASAIQIATSPETQVRRNTVSAVALGVSLSGSHDSRVAANTMAAADIDVRTSNDVRVVDNAVRRISLGVGERNVIRANTVGPVGPFDEDGIEVSATAVDARVIGNVSSGNYGDGIDVAAPGTLIRANTANNNGGLGIRAVAGAIDGGGNTASGNGEPLQCVNVVCP